VLANLGELNFAELMAGGASLALAVAERFADRRLILNDVDEDVANFWRVVSGGEEGEYEDAYRELRTCVEESREPTDQIDFDYWLQQRDAKSTEPGARAFRFLFLNKTTFGGQVDASPIGGFDQRGWQGANNRRVYCQYDVDHLLRSLARTHQLLEHRTEVLNLDVLDLFASLPKQDWLFYLDPPYFPGKSNKLYRKGMDLEKHRVLAEFLRGWERPWVLSYDDHPEVRRLYAWADITPLEVGYSHAPGPSPEQRARGERKKWKRKTELLVLPSYMNKPVSVETTAEFAPPPSARATVAASAAVPPPPPAAPRGRGRPRRKPVAPVAPAELVFKPVNGPVEDYPTTVHHVWCFCDERDRPMLGTLSGNEQQALERGKLRGLDPARVRQFRLEEINTK
jgi:DNA adenine methylase